MCVQLREPTGRLSETDDGTGALNGIDIKVIAVLPSRPSNKQVSSMPCVGWPAKKSKSKVSKREREKVVAEGRAFVEAKKTSDHDYEATKHSERENHAILQVRIALACEPAHCTNMCIRAAYTPHA